MTMVHWLLSAALAAQSAPPVFPCEKLGSEFLEIYDGFEALPAPAPKPVVVARKKVLFERAPALTVRLFTLSDPARAGGMALLFRPYREGGKQIFCTRGRSDALFGSGDEAMMFVLRCLDDRDGDGSYEGFARRLRLVRVRMDKPTPPAPPGPDSSGFIPFAQPVSLVEQPGLVEKNRTFWPRARTQISVVRTSGDSAELSFAGHLDSLSDYAPYWAGRPMAREPGAPTVAVTMREGAVVPVAGTRIRFAKAKGKWTATVLDGFGDEPKLLCSGSVVLLGDTFTIMMAGGNQMIFARSPPRPPR